MPDGVSKAQSLDAVLRTYPSVRVIAPARSKDALIAAIYLAVDAPDSAAANFDALADVLGDLSWLPTGPVRLAWMLNRALPGGVRAQVLDILRDAARTTARSARPLTVQLIDS